MKSIKRDIQYSFLLLILVVAGLGFAFVQKNVQDAEKIKNIIESKRYIFKAESVTPARGALRQLSGSYDLTVKGDTLISYLPYFGRAYSAPIDIDDAAIKFTSVNFVYNVKKSRKNIWQIEFIPKDARNIRQLILNISESGQGSLMVFSNDRERINFDGHITEMTSAR
jgi:hypothetical protein